MKIPRNSNHGNSLCSSIVFVVCCLLLTSLLLPKIARQRAAARASVCADNLKQLGLAIHNYHAAYRQLPQGTGGTVGADDEKLNNAGRLGPLVGILPFIEEQQLWETISNPYISPKTKDSFPPMGPVPWYDASVYQPWGQSPSTYQCPDNAPQVNEVPKQQVVYTLTVPGSGNVGVMANYVACYGDGTLNAGKLLDQRDVDAMRQSRASNRGMFQASQQTKFRDILDGLSNTLMFSETVSSVEGKRGISGIAKDIANLSENPSLCLAAAKDPVTKWWPQGRGSRWSDGLLATSGFQTVLPPNSPSCTSEAGIFDSVVAASSRHDGGVHVLMGDGAVKFVTNQIDCGDSTMPGVAVGRTGKSAPGAPSPYGVWGALGSRASKEIIEEQFDQPPMGDIRDRFIAKPAAETSRWTSKDGKQTLSASFVRIIDKKTIELKSASGTLHQVPLNTLSDKDIYRAVELDLMDAH
ncbi:MAG: DUF1559 domain-containing protein [Pirellulaceae bacterium]